MPITATGKRNEASDPPHPRPRAARAPFAWCCRSLLHTGGCFPKTPDHSGLAKHAQGRTIADTHYVDLRLPYRFRYRHTVPENVRGPHPDPAQESTPLFPSRIVRLIRKANPQVWLPRKSASILGECITLVYRYPRIVHPPNATRMYRPSGSF